jgi:morphogenetic protein associated with SpoVID
VKLHLLKPGEELSQIADRYEMTLDQLLEANPALSGSRDLAAGTKVKIPSAFVKTKEKRLHPMESGVSESASSTTQAPEERFPSSSTPAVPYWELPYLRPSANTYVIQPGDTLWQLTKKFQATYYELKLLNPQITQWEKLEAGTEIQVPPQSVIPVPLQPGPDVPVSGYSYADRPKWSELYKETAPKPGAVPKPPSLPAAYGQMPFHYPSYQQAPVMPPGYGYPPAPYGYGPVQSYPMMGATAPYPGIPQTQGSSTHVGSAPYGSPYARNEAEPAAPDNVASTEQKGEDTPREPNWLDVLEAFRNLTQGESETAPKSAEAPVSTPQSGVEEEVKAEESVPSSRVVRGTRSNAAGPSSIASKIRALEHQHRLQQVSGKSTENKVKGLTAGVWVDKRRG